MTRALALTSLLAVLTAGVAAQSSLVSLFDRYTVNTKWAQLEGGWGSAYTSSVAADGKGTARGPGAKRAVLPRLHHRRAARQAVG